MPEAFDLPYGMSIWFRPASTRICLEKGQEAFCCFPLAVSRGRFFQKAIDFRSSQSGCESEADEQSRSCHGANGHSRPAELGLGVLSRGRQEENRRPFEARCSCGGPGKEELTRGYKTLRAAKK